MHIVCKDKRPVEVRVAETFDMLDLDGSETLDSDELSKAYGDGGLEVV